MSVNVPGVNIFAGSPALSDDLYATTGQVFYVGNGTPVPGGVVGVNSGEVGHTPKQPFSTIDYAIGQCTAGRGDLIIVNPGHAETVTTAIALDVAGVRIIGLGWGRLRPAITPSGAIDTLNVTAANCHIHNLRFVAVAADCTAHVNIAGADFKMTNCIVEQGAVPLIGVTVPRAGTRFVIDRCEFMGMAAGPDNAIVFEGGGGATNQANWRVTNCLFDYGNTGIDEGVIQSSFETLGGLVRDCTMIGVDTLIADFNSSNQVQGDGLLANILVCTGVSISDIDTAIDHGGYHSANVLVSDLVAASAAKTPLVTPA